MSQCFVEAGIPAGGFDGWCAAPKNAGKKRVHKLYWSSKLDFFGLPTGGRLVIQSCAASSLGVAALI